MSDCSKHKTYIEFDKISTIEELVEDIGDLRYDSLAEFLELLADKIQRDGDKDWNGNRTKLALSLYNASVNIKKTKENIDCAWEISKPFMNIKEE
jgi:hypothetical protein